MECFIAGCLAFSGYLILTIIGATVAVQFVTALGGS